MNTFVKTAAVAAALFALPMAASAYTITAANVTATNDVADGVADGGSRFDVDNAYDGDAGTFYSLGDGGSMTVDVSPLTLLSPASVIEVTFNTPNPSWPESAKIFLDNMLAGEIFNNGTATSEAGFTLTSTASGGSMSAFEIAFSGGPFSALTILDTTMTNFASSYTSRVTDGFDVAELSVSVNAVPVPPALGLLAGAIGLLGWTGRRRRQAA